MIPPGPKGLGVMDSNALRLQLWADDALAHRWLCHPDRECADGCDTTADPERLALYRGEIEIARDDSGEDLWRGQAERAIFNGGAS